MYELFLTRGTPEHIRSDNGSGFTANTVRSCLKDLGVTTLYIEPAEPRENGYVESYIGKLRDELLNREILDTLMEAKVLVEDWRKEYNRFRPRSSLGYRCPLQRLMRLKYSLKGWYIDRGQVGIPGYWDGETAERIVRVLTN